jgi:hypothetical protein
VLGIEMRHINDLQFCVPRLMDVDFKLVQYFTANIFSIKEQKIYNGKYTYYTDIFPLETQTGKTSIFYIHP